jgi:hypothetical protein
MFSIFGFASLFSVLPRYGIYEFRCKFVSEKLISNNTATITKDCRGQIDEYQVSINDNKYKNKNSVFL